MVPSPRAAFTFLHLYLSLKYDFEGDLHLFLEGLGLRLALQLEMERELERIGGYDVWGFQIYLLPPNLQSQCKREKNTEPLRLTLCLVLTNMPDDHKQGKLP